QSNRSPRWSTPWNAITATRLHDLPNARQHHSLPHHKTSGGIVPHTEIRVPKFKSTKCRSPEISRYQCRIMHQSGRRARVNNLAGFEHIPEVSGFERRTRVLFDQ